MTLVKWIVLTLAVVRAEAVDPPTLRSLVAPQVWAQSVEGRDIYSVARLDPPRLNLRRYHYSAFMSVRAPLGETKAAITDYRVYPKMSSYITRTAFTPETNTLEIEGGIWKWRLHSHVQFEERGPRWVHYRVTRGHFAGLSGEIYFEDVAERGTAVYFTGEQIGANFPPAFVLERGAEIVFDYVAKKIRGFVEAGGARTPAPTGSGVPKPKVRRI